MMMRRRRKVMGRVVGGVMGRGWRSGRRTAVRGGWLLGALPRLGRRVRVRVGARRRRVMMMMMTTTRKLGMDMVAEMAKALGMRNARSGREA
jgi:hypothetical protein